MPERLDAVDLVHLEIMHSVFDQIPWSAEIDDGCLGIAGINMVRWEPWRDLIRQATANTERPSVRELSPHLDQVACLP